MLMVKLIIFTILMVQCKVIIGTKVWLTVSSLAGLDKKLNKPFERQLELNWRLAPNRTTGLWVGLFEQEPNEEQLIKKGKKHSIEWIAIDGQTSGRHRTSVEFPYKNFSKKSLKKSCLKYWIGLIESNKLLVKDCIKTNPFWMEENLEDIGDRRLTELMIAGTHNSASYDRFSHKDNNLYTKYSLCQDENVFNQLVFGIRFLDLRVAYDKLEGQNYKMWMVHGPVIMKHTLDSILAQVKQFVELAPKEIVVLDFHRLEKGFDKDELSPKLVRRHHRKVFKIIYKHLRQYLVPQQMALNLTINELLTKNKRVVIGYPSNEMVADKTHVNPQAKHLWPNTDHIDDIIEFFNETLCDHYPDQMWSAMAQLTADRFGIILDRYNGLRTMADSVNRVISDAFISSDSDWNRCANVVATDYFLGNNLIDVAIDTNKSRAKKNS